MLGAGGYATVYRAHDGETGRDVAVKVIPTALASGEGIDPAAGEDADTQFDRFRQEALALSRLRSRHIARVYDFGRDAEVGLYLVMELIEGVPLDARSLGRALLPHEVLRVARGLLAGLAEAHEHGISHCDIKPSNVLVPRGGRGLDEPRIIDFGIARDERRATLLAEAVGRTGDASGHTLGTPAFMAPEQLRDGTSSPSSDVYAAGLVLFDLLGVGPLFPGESAQAQVGARLLHDASVEGRVAPPLGTLLARMLERDPQKRFVDAADALEAIGDLETAPVSIGAVFAGEEATDGTSAAETRRGPHQADGTGERTSAPPSVGSVGSVAPASGPGDRTSVAPSHTTVRSETPPSRAPSAYGGRRLSRLPRDPVAALVESIHALDVAMIDALARREARATGAAMARTARAVALALRLELDAAALILEPLASQSDLARALGATLVAPRARRATRARVDADKVDAWIDTVDPELTGMLCALGVAMTLRDEAARNEERCRRAIERAGTMTGPTATTLRMAQLAAGMIAGALTPSSALTEMLRLRDADREPPSAYVALMRSLLLGLVGFRADEHMAREQFERATRVAAETGNTLLEMRAIVAWGGMLVEIPERVEQGLGVLERATTLLGHGDAPSLEHIAEHNRGAALVIQGRYAEAAPHLRRARTAAKGELSLEHEILSCMNEGLSYVALGDRDAAARIVDELSESRIAHVSARAAAYCYVVRSMYATLFETPDRARAELRRAHASAAEAEAEGADAYLLAEALGMLHAAAQHEEVDILARAGELQKLAQDRGFVSFYWFDVLRAMVTRMRDAELRERVGETLEKLVVLLGPTRMTR